MLSVCAKNRNDVRAKVSPPREQGGCPGCLLYVLRENPQARRFYERCGFCWDGTQVEVPLPPETVCTDLRYVRHFDEGRDPA